MKKRTYFFIQSIGIAIILIGCDSTTTTNNTVNNTMDTVVQQASIPVEKSKDEIEVQVAEDIVELGQNILANKRYKDSMRIANKEEMWAYQIGVPFSDIDALSEELEKLNSIEGVAVFEDKGDYLIVKTGDSEEQLLDSLGSFKSQVKKTDPQTTKVMVINLSLKCNKKSNIKEGKARKLKRKFSEIHCYECD